MDVPVPLEASYEGSEDGKGCTAGGVLGSFCHKPLMRLAGTQLGMPSFQTRVSGKSLPCATRSSNSEPEQGPSLFWPTAYHQVFLGLVIRFSNGFIDGWATSQNAYETLIRKKILCRPAHAGFSNALQQQTTLPSKTGTFRCPIVMQQRVNLRAIVQKKPLHPVNCCLAGT